MLKQKNRLRQDEDFNRLYNKGKKISSKFFNIYYSYGSKKIGIVVSKKHGKAVKRNLLKRRIKAIMLTQIPSLKPYNLVIVPKTTTGNLSFCELKKNLIQILCQERIVK